MAAARGLTKAPRRRRDRGGGTMLSLSSLLLCMLLVSIGLLTSGQCALCLDFFTAPVRITNCGHNFCQQCLTEMNDTPWICPECRTEQQQRPEELTRNYFLEKTVGKYIASREDICDTHKLEKQFRKYLNRSNQLFLFIINMLRLRETRSKPLSRMQRCWNVQWSSS